MMIIKLVKQLIVFNDVFVLYFFLFFIYSVEENDRKQKFFKVILLKPFILIKFVENLFFRLISFISFIQSLAGTGDLITNNIENKQDRSNGLAVQVIEPIESIEMKPLNNPTTPIVPSSNLSLHMPPDCFPRIISKHFDCCKYIIPETIQQHWTYLRSKAHRLVEHRFFEWLIIASILASSSTLVS